MLADHVTMMDIDGRHVRGWFDALLPTGLRNSPSWALLVCEGATLHQVVVSGRGALDPSTVEFTGPTRKGLRATREALDVALALAVTPETFNALAADAESKVALDEHYTAQSLHWVSAVRRQKGRSLWLDPPLLDLIPPMSTEALERAFNVFVPDDSALAAYVITDDRKKLEASVIAVKRGGRITDVTTHAALRKRVPESAFAKRWTTDYKRALDVIGDVYAPVSIGLFIEHGALRRILGGPPDQLSRELKTKGAIIDPMPTWLAGLLGGAAAVAVASRGAKRLGGLLPKRARNLAASVAEQASRRAKESGAHPWQILGFDPVELFRRLQLYYV